VAEENGFKPLDWKARRSSRRKKKEEGTLAKRSV